MRDLADSPWLLTAMLAVGAAVLVLLVAVAVVVVRSAVRGGGIRPQRNRRDRRGGSVGNGGTGLP
jgi:hypothetical protein